MQQNEYQKTVLVLQGGGALGAYQAGAYEVLQEHGYVPEWIAGISIGAINGAIIAGNPVAERVPKLRQFWEQVSSGLQALPINGDGHARNWFNDASSFLSLIYGVPGFFSPRPMPPIATPSAPAGLGYYSTAPLRASLAEFVDFDLLNSNGCRFSAGAVNIETGNFEYFDSLKTEISADHVVASGALPPGLPPVKIGKSYYWDGGLVSNTPLQYVLDEPNGNASLKIFQFDLFSARGELPVTLLEAIEREKEIRYSSRTRLNTDMMREKVGMRCALRRLLAKLPEELRADPDAQLLLKQASDPDVAIVHLIYRARAHESHARDYEFSRVSVEEHWEQGQKDARKALASPDWQAAGERRSGVKVFDPTKSD